MKIRSVVFLSLLPVSGVFAQQELKLWYAKPAAAFEETLVIGNGKAGASIFGGTETDSIYLNDITLWTGSPKENKNTEAYKTVDEIRKALRNEQYEYADRLQRKIQGEFSESYAPLGTFYLKMAGTGNVSDYTRELSVDNALTTVQYKSGDTAFRREYFVSYPDGVMVVRLTADKKNALNFDLAFDSQLRHRTSVKDNELVAEGYAPVVCEPSYRGGKKDPIVFDPNRGTRFAALYTIASTDGERVAGDGTIGVRDASEAVIIVSMATSFNGFDKDPAADGADHLAIAAKQLEQAKQKKYERLKKAHQEDYKNLYDRFSLSTGSETASDIPTDKRLERYETGIADSYLERLYIQFGRYLLISASRTLGVPANLQGLWNPHMRPPWSSNYTTNINLQENYWPVEKSNLSELHQPLMQFISNVATTGSKSAREFLGTKGWILCHNSDIWAMSNPVGEYGDGSPQWANWYFGGVWLATHLWEHYIYTGDKDFLREKAYPLMKGAVDFCMDWVVKDRDGHWITSPGTSPENVYISGNGYKGATLYGATADLAMMRELMEQFIRVSDLLNEDPEYRMDVKMTLANLRPYQVGNKGNLMEWYHDWEDAEPWHRHTTHLFGLFPGSHISPQKTPELAEACRRTLELRTDESTGWAMGWRINLWARLLDGNHAYKMFRRLLAYVPATDDGTGRHRRGGTYPNLFDAHPPFQIDGNFGAVSGIIEMLLQSYDGYINILPALPAAWMSEGNFKGIKAQGNIEADAEWKNGKVVSLYLKSPEKKEVKVFVNGEMKEVNLKANRKVRVKVD